MHIPPYFGKIYKFPSISATIRESSPYFFVQFIHFLLHLRSFSSPYFDHAFRPMQHALPVLDTPDHCVNSASSNNLTSHKKPFI